MSSALPIPPVCPSCGTQINTQIPGSPGAAGSNGTAGTNGLNASTTTTATFVMPVLAGSVVVSVVNNSWMTVGAPVIVDTAGVMQVTARDLGGLLVTLKNISTGSGAGNAYPNNALSGTVISSASVISPTGFQGPTGALTGLAGPGGDLVGNYPAPTLILIPNMGIGPIGDGTHVSQVTTDTKGRVTALASVPIVFPVALPPNGLAGGGGGDLTGSYPNPTLITIPGGVIGPIGNSTTIPIITRDTNGRVTALTSVAANPRYTLLGSLLNVDLSLANHDWAIPISAISSRYRLDRITVENASTSLTTATASIYTAGGGGGINVAADQVLSALTASTMFKDLALTANYAPVTGNQVLTSISLQFRVGTLQAGPATANVWVYGWRLD